MNQVVDIAAERAVLGGVMLEASVVWDVLEVVRAVDFADPALAKVYEAIAELAHANQPLDPIAVTDRLQRTGRTDARVTAVLAHELVAETPTGANAPYYAAIVRDLAKRRRLQEASQTLAALATGEGDAEALVERARAVVDEVSVATVTQAQRIGATVWDLVEALRERPTFEATPWPALDRIIGGFRPGALYVVAARPGVGKTVVGLQVARALAEHGPVGFVSLEMPVDELQKRLVSSVGEVPLTALVNHQLVDRDWRQFAQARPIIEALELYVQDDLSTPMQVASFARTLHRQGRMQALVIDYLQLLAPDERAESREAALSEMTRKFKQLAQQLGIPVVLLSQLNRQSTQRKGKGAEKPQLSDLRGSGAIEQDADLVLLLHREKPRGAVLEVNVAKNRHGPSDSFELQWEGQYARAVPKKWSATALLEQEEVT